jgi:hypothetical protein
MLFPRTQRWRRRSGRAAPPASCVRRFLLIGIGVASLCVVPQQLSSEGPLWVISGLSSQHHSTSALPPQADIQVIRDLGPPKLAELGSTRAAGSRCSTLTWPSVSSRICIMPSDMLI